MSRSRPTNDPDGSTHLALCGIISRLDCPGENTIVAFAEGSLGPDVVAGVEAHAARCALCQELLAAALGTGVRRRAVGDAGTDAATTVAPRREGPEGTLPRGTPLGRYTILSFVGRGGMGDVYAAYDPELDRKVALKLLRANKEKDPTRGHARLLREAKSMARVSHPNVVAVHDAGTFGARVFVAMEFVDGMTLRDWLAERPRARREILDVFVEAAAGLTAAHAAGLVHRDFKPGNVLIARDGTVRVTDFGLARQLGDLRDAATVTEDPAVAVARPHDTLTGTGELLGTPLYMAPEQFRAQETDARTDQFGFCVALYQALYGVSPFGQGNLASLMADVLAGRVQPAPPKSTVPAWLRRVLLRGLSVSSDTRWPSMRELVVALKRDPAQVRRRWALGASALMLVALSGITLARNAGKAPSLCRGGAARLAGVWELTGAGAGPYTRRDAVQRAFLSSGAPGARDIWDRVAALLDRYATGWLAGFEDACAATHLRGEQPAKVLDLRMGCLDERRTALVALTDVLADADRNVVEKGVDAANALPDLARCGDLKQLEVPIEPPRDEATRARVAELRRRLATAKALNDAGKHAEAMALARRLVDEARTLEYRPVLAEALGGLSSVFNGIQEGTEIVPLLEEEIGLAIIIDRNDLGATAAMARADLANRFDPNAEGGKHWQRLAHALLDRAGGKYDLLRSWFLQGEAFGRIRVNDFQGGLTLTRQALALKEKILPKGHPDIGISLSNEADFLHNLGNNTDALRVSQRAYDLLVAAYGPASFHVAAALANRGAYLIDLGRSAEALEPLRDGLSRLKTQLGPEHPSLAFPLTDIGRAFIALDRPMDAIPSLEEALRLRDPSRTAPGLAAETQFALARALADVGDSPSRAHGLAMNARDGYLQVPDEAHAATVDAWLAAHPQARHARAVER